MFAELHSNIQTNVFAVALVIVSVLCLCMYIMLVILFGLFVCLDMLLCLRYVKHWLKVLYKVNIIIIIAYYYL